MALLKTNRAKKNLFFNTVCFINNLFLSHSFYFANDKDGKG